MKPMKPSKYFASALLTLSLLPTGSAFAISPQALAVKLQQLSQNAKVSEAEKLAMKTQAIQYFTSILSINTSDVAAGKQINPLIIKDLAQQDTTAQETRILTIWSQMVNDGTLQANIGKLIEEIKASPTPLAEMVKKMPQDQLNYAVATLKASIEATVRVRGLSKDSASNHYREWSELSQIMSGKVEKSDPTNPLDLANSAWIKTESAEVLINGPASFAKRDQFMRDATTSINILTWSIYDDLTGTQTADILIKKKKENPGLKIRVMVDGQVAATSGHGVQVQRLQDAGIEVIRWFSKDFAYMGQHRKMLIIDNQHLIAGGLNFGDVYSHKNPDLSVPRWRDTDIYIKGAGAEEGNRLFAKLWNDQLSEQTQLKYDQIKLEAKPAASNAPGIEISLINSDPRTTNSGSTVMLTILKAIREAKQQVDIENAYIILFPALKKEIANAIQRGVHVRVFTNSSESVDEPVVSIPILRSVTEFITMGAEVYVKKGATLHSKLVVVDSDLTLIMSYNLHPRSERVEGEMAVAIRDVQFAQNMHKVFDNDVTADKATLLKEVKDVKMPSSPVSVPTLRLFFDML